MNDDKGENYSHADQILSNSHFHSKDVNVSHIKQSIWGTETKGLSAIANLNMYVNRHPKSTNVLVGEYKVV